MPVHAWLGSSFFAEGALLTVVDEAMANNAAKKKQDEKNLQILRELVAKPLNKKCFECQQRGPTYADMTTTAFLCTSCSGLL